MMTQQEMFNKTYIGMRDQGRLSKIRDYLNNQ